MSFAQFWCFDVSLRDHGGLHIIEKNAVKVSGWGTLWKVYFSGTVMIV